MEGKLGRLINRVRGRESQTAQMPETPAQALEREERYIEAMTRWARIPRTMSEQEVRSWLNSEAAKRGVTLMGERNRS